MTTINLTCDTCGKVHVVERTSEIPGYVMALACNWCPCCEDRAGDYWEQRYLPDEDGGEGNEPIIPIPDNQLCLPFIMDEIGVPKSQELKTETA